MGAPILEGLTSGTPFAYGSDRRESVRISES